MNFAIDLIEGKNVRLATEASLDSFPRRWQFLVRVEVTQIRILKVNINF